MIFEAIVNALVALCEFVIGLMGDLEPPSWVVNLLDPLNEAIAYVAPVGVWIPFGTLGTVLGTMGSLVLAAFGVRVVRILLSLFTGGGGSAA